MLTSCRPSRAHQASADRAAVEQTSWVEAELDVGKVLVDGLEPHDPRRDHGDADGEPVCTTTTSDGVICMSPTCLLRADRRSGQNF
jgi:hypothetical protein